MEGWSRNNTNMVISDRACKTTVHMMLKNSYPHTYSMQYANSNVIAATIKSQMLSCSKDSVDGDGQIFSSSVKRYRFIDTGR